jgi:hypothetical protein
LKCCANLDFRHEIHIGNDGFGNHGLLLGDTNANARYTSGLVRAMLAINKEL